MDAMQTLINKQIGYKSFLFPKIFSKIFSSTSHKK